MGILTQLKPHVVSRDLRGYSVLFYGTPKSGKTTIASKFPGSIIFAFEKGYSTIPGVMAQPINSWNEFRRLLVELKDEETKKMFQTVVIDTADIAYDYCQQYICDDNNVDNIGDLAYGKGYALVEKEFDSCLRKIIQLDYGLVLISHSTERTEKDEQGNEYSKIEPTLDKRGRKICERTCDIIGLSRAVTSKETGQLETRLFLRETPRFVAGSRFKYIPDSIVFTYENLVNAIGDAIDKEAAEHDNAFVTNDRKNEYKEHEIKMPKFSEMRQEAEQLFGTLIGKSPDNKLKISKIITEYLGAGKKFQDTTEADAEKVWLIIQELRVLNK
jgi:hypothetical protein